MSMPPPDPQQTSSKLLVVEDHDDLRLGLCMLLDRVDGFEVVGAAANGREALELVASKMPDVVIMDIGMPVMDGIEACARLRETFPAVKIIMLTSRDNDDEVFASLSAGANGYCLKGTDIHRLATAIDSVRRGDLWIDSAIAGKVLKALSMSPHKEAAAVLKRDSQSSINFPALSPRELEVLKLLVDGLTNQEISRRLDISIETVKTHIRHIMDKLAVNDRTQAAVQAVRRGYI